MPLLRPHNSSLASCATALTLALAAVVTLAVVTVAVPQPAAAASRDEVVSAAYTYGHQRGYHVGIAVLDTKTGRTYEAGDHAGTFASESVVKVLIATRVYLQGRLHGATARRVYTMITQSDDQIADSLYGSAGGDGLVTALEEHFHVPDLGSRPHRSGWWGNTHITPDGLVALYGKLKAMPRFGAWLLNAMHHATRHGSDGFYQWFGLKAANADAAIKQGWGTDYDNWGAGADENTTGFVDGDRYAIAILARGPSSTYGGPISAMLTVTAKRLLPGGVFPTDAPVLTSLGSTTGGTAGGVRVTVHGRNLTGATAVYFGSVAAGGLRRISDSTASVLVPAHAAGPTRVRIVTPLGSSGRAGPTFTYVAAPVVTAVTPAQAAAGTTVTVSGRNFVGPRVSVRFGDAATVVAQVGSSSTVSVVVPAGLVGPVDLRVVTPYGTSAVSPGDRFGYPSSTPAPPSTTEPDPTPPGG